MGYADLSPIDVSRIQAARDRQFLRWTNSNDPIGMRKLLHNAFILLELSEMGITPQSIVGRECLEEYAKIVSKD